MTESSAAKILLEDELSDGLAQALKALKTYSRLQKILSNYLSSEQNRKDVENFEKKARAILADAGMARSIAMEKVKQWSAIKKTDAEKIIEKNQQQQTIIVTNETNDKAQSDDKPKRNLTKAKEKQNRIGQWVEEVNNQIVEPTISPLEIALAELAIRATSQESRFYTESITTATQEIDLKDVNLFVGEKQLLTDAHLRIKEGKKYGLVGRNGCGKSTLLRAMGDGIIPGLPANLKILLVSQLGIEESMRILTLDAGKTLSVLDAVLQGDKKRIRAEQELEILSKAIDKRDAIELEKVVKELWLNESFENLEEARRISSKRSGTRGKHARTALINAEKAYEEAKSGFISYSNNDWEQQASKLHSKALIILEETDAATVIPRAHSILHGLGFTSQMILQPYASLSGGWKSRCALASALLQSNHILLLDEPVNFLDLPSILWLEQWVKRSFDTIITVAHDVEFLNMISDELIIIKNNKLEYFDGNLHQYTRTKRRNLKHALKQQDALDKKKQVMEKSIQEGLRQAKKSGDDNRMRMAKSRQKKLEERWGLERNAAGHRFKLNRDFGGYHLTSRGGVEIEDEGPTIRYTFPDPESLPFAASLLHIEDVTFQHEKAINPLFSKVNITIDIGDRIGLVGPNGHGKSTLMQLVVGERVPTSGTIQKHTRLRLGYYSQQAISDIAFQTSNKTALDHFIEHCSNKEIFTIESRARGFLAQFELKGRTVDALPVGKLSGGQKVKLLLAEVLSLAPHLLILDEVTTHMDSDSIKALIGALKKFKGAVLFISHDRHAVKSVIDGNILKVNEEGSSSSEEEEDSDSSQEYDSNGEMIVNAAGTAIQRKTFLVYNGNVNVLENGVQEYVDNVEKTISKAMNDETNSNDF